MPFALLCCLLVPAAPDPLLVCDFDAQSATWRSKFDRLEVVEAEGRGKVLKLDINLAERPNYDWVRAYGLQLDLRPYRYFNARLGGDGHGAGLAPMLMQTAPASGENPHGEIIAGANNYLIVPDGPWQLISVPLSAFANLDAIAGNINMVNFSLRQRHGEAAPGTVLIDDISFSTTPLGKLVPEDVPYPPADITVPDMAALCDGLDLTRPDLAAVKAAAEQHDWPAAKQAWLDHLRARTTPRWTFSRRDREAIVKLVNEQFNGFGGSIRGADTALARDFHWLGVRKQLNHDIDWLQGPVEWTHVLSRFGYWNPMGQAWWATGDAKYPEDFVYMMQDWVADNPVPRILTNGRGPNGTVWRTLETGIRGDGWWDALEYFVDADAFDAEAAFVFTKSMIEQARHLHRYTVAMRAGNWQVVECTGLAAVGIMLPEAKEAAAWRQRAFEYLVRHMEEDVYPDGGHSELTPGYHTWVMERFLKVALLCQANGYEVPGLLERHERMFEFLMALARGNRRFPSLGDAGSGGSIESWMGLGALLYHRPDMRYLAADKPSGGWIWMFGPQVVADYARLESQPPASTFSWLPQSQYATMRTGWTPEDLAVTFDLAPWGGGHSHQDWLQVLLWAGGRDLLLDAGQYSYDQPLSGSYFRKAAAHGVVLIDGQIPGTCDPTPLVAETTPAADFVAGEAPAGDGTVTHRRSVLFVKPDYVVVVDHLLGQGPHRVTRTWHLPECEPLAAGRTVQTPFTEGWNVSVTALDGAPVTMTKGWLPKGGADAKEAPVAEYHADVALPAVLVTVLRPFEGDAEKIAMQAELSGLVANIDVTVGGRSDRIRVTPDVVDGARATVTLGGAAPLKLGGAR